MERRRIIGIVLLAVAGVACLVSVVWNLIRMPEGADARIRVAVYLLVEVALMAPAVWAFTHPDSKPPLKEKGQEPMQRIIDPAGYRYITLGLAALTLILLINIEVFKATGWDPFGSLASTIAILAYCIVATVVMFWSTHKSIQK
ncbi:MAG: hypothetical protein IJ785_01290 [Bacteroidales bacterium]|nr:hypothetical protein [Bacteroidales bacterium]